MGIATNVNFLLEVNQESVNMHTTIPSASTPIGLDIKSLSITSPVELQLQEEDGTIQDKEDCDDDDGSIEEDGSDYSFNNRSTGRVLKKDEDKDLKKVLFKNSS